MEPFLLSLLSLNGKFGDWDSREKLAPTQESFVAGVSATETAATYRSGCLRSGKLPWSHTSVARRDPPIKPALLASCGDGEAELDWRPSSPRLESLP